MRRLCAASSIPPLDEDAIRKSTDYQLHVAYYQGNSREEEDDDDNGDDEAQPDKQNFFFRITIREFSERFRRLLALHPNIPNREALAVYMDLAKLDYCKSL